MRARVVMSEVDFLGSFICRGVQCVSGGLLHCSYHRGVDLVAADAIINPKADFIAVDSRLT